MSTLKCPDCQKKLLEAEGSYRISVNCRACKKIVLFESAKPALKPIQHLFENQIAPAGERVNNPR